MELTVRTVGHSTPSSSEFLAVLAPYTIEAVADVRRFPGSRRQPQYQQSTFQAALAAEGIEYCWLPALGGRRRPDPQSSNGAWRHQAFRGYADHTASEEFAAGWFELLLLAHGLRTAVMCAEVLWWRCHRRLIADVLVSLGVQVVHILDAATAQPHLLAPPARLVDGRLTYVLQGPAGSPGALP
ncbi:MAG: DUF488 domain-containing protein [Gemmatimonadales bacterium]|nr:DUF488 domain-containing protein [Gemmatimonadales bacterium]